MQLLSTVMAVLLAMQVVTILYFAHTRPAPIPRRSAAASRLLWSDLPSSVAARSAAPHPPPFQKPKKGKDEGPKGKLAKQERVPVKQSTRPVPPPPPPQSEEPLCETHVTFGTRQRGADLSNMQGNNAEDCARLCMAEPSCRGATFQKEASMCWLHSALLPRVPDLMFDFVTKKCSGDPQHSQNVPWAKLLGTDVASEPEANSPRQDPGDLDFAVPQAGGGGDSENGAVGRGVADGLVWENPPRQILRLRHAAVIILCYDRPEYLKTTIEALLAAPLASEIKIYISQDGNHRETNAVARSFGSAVTHIQHRRAEARNVPHTSYLAKHYKWALDQLFIKNNHSHAIVLEDDLQVSPDFFEYFEQTSSLLDADPTLWCVSSWNDYGHNHFDLPPQRLFRNSFFPGLGWMLKRELWLELRQGFPDDHWDHWMRVSGTHKGRDCVCPFLSRNFNIGEQGANIKKTEYNRYFRTIAVNKAPGVPLGDLRYLLHENYREAMQARLQRGQVSMQLPQFTENMGRNKPPIIVPYKREQWPQLAQQLKVMPTVRAHHNYTTLLLVGGGREVILVDQRRSPYISARSEIAVRPNPQMRVFAAQRAHQSCDAVCEAQGMACGAEEFDFINKCSVLQQYFRCNSCGFDMGPDIPNFVIDPHDRHHGQCLETDELPTCAASHRATRRLCPCVPSDLL